MADISNAETRVTRIHISTFRECIMMYVRIEIPVTHVSILTEGDMRTDSNGSNIIEWKAIGKSIAMNNFGMKNFLMEHST